MRHTLLVLASAGILLLGCQQKPPPEPPVAPPADDLAHWSLPTLVQSSSKTLPTLRQATAAEQVFAYVPGSVYKVTVGLDAPLDLIFEVGEQIRNIMGTDPDPLPSAVAQSVEGSSVAEDEQRAQQAQQAALKTRWEVKEAVHGSGSTVQAHLLLRALATSARYGLTIMTSKRVYYLTCTSRASTRVRAVWWTYADAALMATTESDEPLLPLPDVPRLYHAGYEISTSSPPPAWTPLGAWDDGKKFYLVYPERVVFGTVPLVRLIGPNGPQVVNTFQVLNVVMLDLADVPRVELRVGTGPGAEIVTIRRGLLRTISCPGDGACPRFPAAAATIRGGD